MPEEMESRARMRMFRLLPQFKVCVELWSPGEMDRGLAILQRKLSRDWSVVRDSRGSDDDPTPVMIVVPRLEIGE